MRLEAFPIRLEAIPIRTNVAVPKWTLTRLQSLHRNSNCHPTMERPSLLSWRPSILGWRPSLFGWEAIPMRLEAFPIRLEAFAIRLEAFAIAIRLGGRLGGHPYEVGGLPY